MTFLGRVSGRRMGQRPGRAAASRRAVTFPPEQEARLRDSGSQARGARGRNETGYLGE